MSLISLAGVFAPLAFAGTFALFISDRAPTHLPGAPWLLAAGLLFCALLVGWRYARERPATVASWSHAEQEP
jgi:DHA1 family tetracycline resistance protein-like MFS transporter